MKNLFKYITVILITITIFNCSKNDDGGAAPNQAPEAFALIAVTNNDTGVDVKPNFSWQEAVDPENDAVSYSLYVGNEADPTTLLAENISSTNYQPTERLLMYANYNWKVVAKDSKGATTTSNMFSFATRGLNMPTQAVTTNAPFSERYLHSSVMFDNKLWVIAGRDDGSPYNNDVWYSADGITWTEATTNAPFSGRQYHSSVVFDNKLWVIAGSDGSYKKDVWYSADGTTWTEATASAPFSGRGGHSSVVFDNKLWVIGGYDGSSKNDVWYSADGISWTAATASAPFSGREGHSSVVFDNKLWVIGGFDFDGAQKNDVWYSADGISWTEATANAPFSGRYLHSSVVLDNKLWVIAGNDDGSLKNDVWAFE